MNELRQLTSSNSVISAAGVRNVYAPYPKYVSICITDLSNEDAAHIARSATTVIAVLSAVVYAIAWGKC